MLKSLEWVLRIIVNIWKVLRRKLLDPNLCALKIAQGTESGLGEQGKKEYGEVVSWKILLPSRLEEKVAWVKLGH